MSKKAYEFGHAARVRQNFAERLLEFIDTLKSANDVLRQSLNLKNDSKLEIAHDKLDICNIDILQKRAARLKESKYRFLIAGQSNAGKSTLLNVLLGQPDLLPTSSTACTFIPTVVKGGASQIVKLYTGEQFEEISFADFKRKYQIDGERAKRLRKGDESIGIDNAEIEYPHQILQYGIEFTDTAGLNRSDIEDKKTLEYIANVDAILYVVDATQQFDVNDKKYFKKNFKELISNSTDNIFFILNRWDEIKDELLEDDPNKLKEAEKRIRESCISSIADVLGCDNIKAKNLWNKRVFEVSSKNEEYKLKGNFSGDTGIYNLVQEIENFFFNQERFGRELRRDYETASIAYNEIRKYIDIKLLGQKISLEKLQATEKELKPKLRELKTTHMTLKRIINTEVDKFISEVCDDFESYARKCYDNCLEIPESLPADLKDFCYLSPEIKGVSHEYVNLFIKNSEITFEQYSRRVYSKWFERASERLKRTRTTLLEEMEKYSISYNETRSEIEYLLEELSSSDMDQTSSASLTMRSPRNISNLSGLNIDNNPIGNIVGSGLYISMLIGSIALPIGAAAGGGTIVAGVGVAGKAGLLATAQAWIYAHPLITATAITALLSTSLAVWIGREQKKSEIIWTVRNLLKEQFWQYSQQFAEELRRNIAKTQFSNLFEAITLMENDIRACEEPISRLIADKKASETSYKENKELFPKMKNDLKNSWEQIESAYEPYKQ